MKNEGKKRRWARVRCSFLLLREFLLGNLRRAQTSLPSDVRVIAVRNGLEWKDPVAGWFEILVESDEFPEIEDGFIIPEIAVTHTTIEEEA